MLKRIKSFLAASEGEEPDLGQTGSSHMLAAAALMVEAAHMDEDFAESERQTIARVLREQFELSEAEAQDLIAEAEKAQDEANHLLRFTRAIKDNFDHEERVEIMEMLWEVVYADGELCQYESNLMRRVAGLIYVSDRERGEARKRVLARREKTG